MRTLFIGGIRRGYLTLKSLAESGADIKGDVGKKLLAWRTESLKNPLRYIGCTPGRVVSICKSEGHVA